MEYYQCFPCKHVCLKFTLEVDQEYYPQGNNLRCTILIALKCDEYVKINTSLIMMSESIRTLLRGVMDHQIHPRGQLGRIDSARTNPSLLMMRECDESAEAQSKECHFEALL